MDINWELLLFRRSFLYFHFWKGIPMKTEIPKEFVLFWRASSETLQNFLHSHNKTPLTSSTRTIRSSKCGTHQWNIYCLGKPLAVIFIPSAFRHREFSRAGWGCLLDSCQKLGRECLACHGRWRARRGTVTELHHPSTPRLWLQLSHHPPALTQTPALLTFL